MSMDFSHLIVFVLGLIVGGGVTYKVTTQLKIGGGVSQRDINAGGDVVAGDKVNKK